MSAFFVVLIACINAWFCGLHSHVAAADQTSLPFLSAMCQSRCLEKHDEVPSCKKPCLELKLHTMKNIKKCKKFCQDRVPVSGAAACAGSCSFLLQYLLNAKTSSDICSKGKACAVPASPVALNVTDKNATLSELCWSSPAQAPWAMGTMFIITSRTRASQESQFGSWVQISQTTQVSLLLSSLEEPSLWHQFQVVAVNKFGASRPKQSAVVQLAIHRPNPPRDLKVTSVKVNSKGTVSVELSWKKPLDLDVPVHRYRIFWSERLPTHKWTTELVSLKVHHARVLGTTHVFWKDKLQPNYTYVFELQTVCLWRSNRLRSKRIRITILTPSQSGKTTTVFSGSQNTKIEPGIKDTKNKAPIEGPSALTKAANSTTSGAPSRTSPTTKTAAQPGLITAAILLVMLLHTQIQEC